jgi:hypothetical protein
VILKAFDASGRRVSTLVNDNLGAGNHTVDWNARNVPGGVYFINLIEKSGSRVKKVVIY